MKYFKGISFYIVLLVIILAILSIFSLSQDPETKSYTHLLSQLNKVQSISLEGNKATVVSQKEKYTVIIPSIEKFMDEVNPYVKNNQIALEGKPLSTAPWWVTILPTVGLIVIFILFWVFFSATVSRRRRKQGYVIRQKPC